jgi:osmotically inducible protein OsmC
MSVVQRAATVRWEGSLTGGRGALRRPSAGAGSEALSWDGRVGPAIGPTSPEELIAAAHAGCYSMSLSNVLAEAGWRAERIDVTAACGLERETLRISFVDLTVEAAVPGLDAPAFRDLASAAESACPVSNALRGNVEIRLRAQLAAG